MGDQVRFIRRNGRVIPIHAKRGSAKDHDLVKGAVASAVGLAGGVSAGAISEHLLKKSEVQFNRASRSLFNMFNSKSPLQKARFQGAAGKRMELMRNLQGGSRLANKVGVIGASAFLSYGVAKLVRAVSPKKDKDRNEGIALGIGGALGGTAVLAGHRPDKALALFAGRVRTQALALGKLLVKSKVKGGL
jgi:hypothetical protein